MGTTPPPTSTNVIGEDEFSKKVKDYGDSLKGGEESTAFFTLVVDVFLPIAKLSSVERSSEVDKALWSFHQEFRIKLREIHPYLPISILEETLRKGTTAAVNRLEDVMPPQLLSPPQERALMKENLEDRIRIESGWMKAVNDLKRSQYWNELVREEVFNLKQKLGDKFPLGKGEVHDDAKIREVADAVRTSAAARILSCIPKEESDAKKIELGDELNLQLSQVTTKVLETNTNHRESYHRQILNEALTEYKLQMTKLLESNLLTKEEDLHKWHLELKLATERGRRMHQEKILEISTNLRTSWDNMIMKLFKDLVEEWRNRKTSSIDQVRESLRTQFRQVLANIRKAARKELNGDVVFSSALEKFVTDEFDLNLKPLEIRHGPMPLKESTTVQPLGMPSASAGGASGSKRRPTGEASSSSDIQVKLGSSILKGAAHAAPKLKKQGEDSRGSGAAGIQRVPGPSSQVVARKKVKLQEHPVNLKVSSNVKPAKRADLPLKKDENREK